MENGKNDTKDFEIVKSRYCDWDTVLKNPGDIRLEVLRAGTVPGTVHTLMELSDEQKKEYKDVKLKAPLFAFLIRHGAEGDFLVDTGFDSVYAEKPWGHFLGKAKETVRYEVEKGKGIEEQLEQRDIRLKGVFCTHFHEHQGGAPSLPDDITFVFGQGEEEINHEPYVYTRFLENKTDKQTVDFSKADEMPVTGRSIDIFGDGSFWAIDTAGHTKGHMSFLVNGVEGQYMITGDVCMCIKGYELGVESGRSFAVDPERNSESFLKIRRLLEAYPCIKPLFGHETEEFRIAYES